MPGRNKHTNFRSGGDLEVFTLDYKGLNVNDCRVLAESGILDKPKTEDEADVACKVYRVADKPVIDSIFTQDQRQEDR